jgi:hopanoid-associated phosphorylase
VPRPGIVIAATGLRAEARIAARSERVKAVPGGASENRLAALLEEQLADASGIISFGIAGALRSGLSSGACVIGTSVVAGEQSYMADRAWTAHLLEALPFATGGIIVGSTTIIAEPEMKGSLHRSTGGIAADMESHIVGRLAAERGLPFAVLRAIADTADQRLPRAAAEGLKPDGTSDIFAVVKSLACDPGQLSELIRVAFATRRAMRTLLRCHRLLGPGLGFVDFH